MSTRWCQQPDPVWQLCILMQIACSCMHVTCVSFLPTSSTHSHHPALTLPFITNTSLYVHSMHISPPWISGLLSQALSEQCGKEASVMLWVEPQKIQFSHWGYPLRGRRRDKHLIVQSNGNTQTHVHIHYSCKTQASHSFLLLRFQR